MMCSGEKPPPLDFLLTEKAADAKFKDLSGSRPESDLHGRVAQRESTGLTSRGSQVQILFRLPLGKPAHAAGA